MQFDFSHWSTLPTVSCTCITYGRPDLLGEAVKSFLDQDYPGEAELVILNDDSKVSLSFHEALSENRSVRIINSMSRFPTIGEKRNRCTENSSGELILPWDDDDIHLPWRISITVSRMKNHHHWKPTTLWYWTNGEIKKRAPTKAMAPSMAGYSRKVFDTVGGYDHIQSGQDQTLENKFNREGIRTVEELPSAEVYYIYRFAGTGSYHLSSYGYGKGFENVKKFVEKKKIVGKFLVDPHYKQDYKALIREICDEM